MKRLFLILLCLMLLMSSSANPGYYDFRNCIQ